MLSTRTSLLRHVFLILLLIGHLLLTLQATLQGRPMGRSRTERDVTHPLCHVWEVFCKRKGEKQDKHVLQEKMSSPFVYIPIRTFGKDYNPISSNPPENKYEISFEKTTARKNLQNSVYEKIPLKEKRTFSTLKILRKFIKQGLPLPLTSNNEDFLKKIAKNKRRLTSNKISMENSKHISSLTKKDNAGINSRLNVAVDDKRIFKRDATQIDKPSLSNTDGEFSGKNNFIIRKASIEKETIPSDLFSMNSDHESLLLSKMSSMSDFESSTKENIPKLSDNNKDVYTPTLPHNSNSNIPNFNSGSLQTQNNKNAVDVKLINNTSVSKDVADFTFSENNRNKLKAKNNPELIDIMYYNYTSTSRGNGDFNIPVISNPSEFISNHPEVPNIPLSYNINSENYTSVSQDEEDLKNLKVDQDNLESSIVPLTVGAYTSISIDNDELTLLPEENYVDVELINIQPYLNESHPDWANEAVNDNNTFLKNTSSINIVDIADYPENTFKVGLENTENKYNSGGISLQSEFPYNFSVSVNVNESVNQTKDETINKVLEINNRNINSIPLEHIPVLKQKRTNENENDESHNFTVDTVFVLDNHNQETTTISHTLNGFSDEFSIKATKTSIKIEDQISSGISTHTPYIYKTTESDHYFAQTATSHWGDNAELYTENESKVNLETRDNEENSFFPTNLSGISDHIRNILITSTSSTLENSYFSIDDINNFVNKNNLSKIEASTVDDFYKTENDLNIRLMDFDNTSTNKVHSNIILDVPTTTSQGTYIFNSKIDQNTGMEYEYFPHLTKVTNLESIKNTKVDSELFIEMSKVTDAILEATKDTSQVHNSKYLYLPSDHEVLSSMVTETLFQEPFYTLATEDLALNTKVSVATLVLDSEQFTETCSPSTVYYPTLPSVAASQANKEYESTTNFNDENSHKLNQNLNIKSYIFITPTISQNNLETAAESSNDYPAADTEATLSSSFEKERSVSLKSNDEDEFNLESNLIISQTFPLYESQTVLQNTNFKEETIYTSVIPNTWPISINTSNVKISTNELHSSAITTPRFYIKTNTIHSSSDNFFSLSFYSESYSDLANNLDLNISKKTVDFDAKRLNPQSTFSIHFTNYDLQNYISIHKPTLLPTSTKPPHFLMKSKQVFSTVSNFDIQEHSKISHSLEFKEFIKPTKFTETAYSSYTNYLFSMNSKTNLEIPYNEDRQTEDYSIPSASELFSDPNEHTLDSVQADNDPNYLIRTERQVAISPDGEQNSENENSSNDEIIRTERDLEAVNENYPPIEPNIEVGEHSFEEASRKGETTNGAVVPGVEYVSQPSESNIFLTTNQDINSNIDLNFDKNRETISPNLGISTEFQLGTNFDINTEIGFEEPNTDDNLDTDIPKINLETDPQIDTKIEIGNGTLNIKVGGNVNINGESPNFDASVQFGIAKTDIDEDAGNSFTSESGILQTNASENFNFDKVHPDEETLFEKSLTSGNVMTTPKTIQFDDEFSKDVFPNITLQIPTSLDPSNERENASLQSTDVNDNKESTTSVSGTSALDTTESPKNIPTTENEEINENTLSTPSISAPGNIVPAEESTEYSSEDSIKTSIPGRNPRDSENSGTSSQTQSQSTLAATTEIPMIPFYFTIDADYDEVVGSKKTEFEECLTKQLGVAMRVPLDCIQNLQVKKGSIEVNFDLQPNSDHGHLADEKALKAAADELKRMIDNGQLNVNDLNGNTLVVIPIDPPTMPPPANAIEHTTLILGVIIGAFILTVIMVAITAIIIKRKSSGEQRLSPIEEARSKLPSYREIPFQEALFMKGPGHNKCMLGKYCYNTGQWLGPGPEPVVFEAPESVVYRPPTDSEIRRTPRPATAVRERLKHDWEVDWDSVVSSR